MGYIRKTVDEFVLMSNYGYGYEEEITENTYKEIKTTLKEYRDNCRNASFYFFKRRVKLI